MDYFGDPSFVNEGKIFMPYSERLEKNVLGALIIDENAFNKVFCFLKSEVFYSQANRLIFEIIANLHEDDIPIDFLIVSNELKKQDAYEKMGGDVYLAEVISVYTSAVNIIAHTSILLQKYLGRELIFLSDRVAKASSKEEQNMMELIEDIEKSIIELSSNQINVDTRPMKTIFPAMLEEIEININNPDKKGILSGFTGIDSITGGWKKSDMIVLASRPSMGKTALMLNMVKNIAVNQQIPVAVFSIEMSTGQLFKRLLASYLNLPCRKFTDGGVSDQDWERIHLETENFREAPIYINDMGALNIQKFKAEAQNLVNDKGVELIMIDYLQLIITKKRNKTINRQEEIAYISRTLKNMAKNLNVPIVALSQMSRLVEQRADKRPVLSDLRESGAIEQDADIVTFLYRPEYYGIAEWDDDEHTSTENQAEFIIAKNRNGMIGQTRLHFFKETQVFSDILTPNLNHKNHVFNETNHEPF